MIATQAAFAFPGTAARVSAFESLPTPYKRVAAAFIAANPGTVAKDGPSLGNKVDAVEITADGRLALIEIKPPTAAAGIYWGPLQVSYYATVYSEWAKHDPNAHTVLQTIYGQRRQLRLLCERPPLTCPAEIVPVLLIGLPINPKTEAVVKPLAQALQAALLATGKGWPNLEVWGAPPGRDPANLHWFS